MKSKKIKNLEKEIEICLETLKKFQDIDFFKEFIKYVITKNEGDDKRIIKAYNTFIKKDKELREECEEYKTIRKISEIFWPFTYYFIRSNLENLYRFLEDLYYRDNKEER